MENGLGLIELILTFALILGVLVWQLVSVRREMRRDREKERDGGG